ncbi:DUF6437 family protein [Sphingomonas jatrophae]|uniref:DUF64370 domain-containing protein n=1 Tax=Sphingomonas jatrophae TaxID=1166337 RepID=A0A1I6L7S5_9SPHN|nr:DUF6437 family protein [Sphingomonas jatrophae]SFR99526.1 hypothetical protein SAMN05192580_2416 [Sphingomonas jatrophae]
MAKKKPSALDALTRHDEEERRLASLRDALRQAAALELGTIVLDAGGGALGSEGLRVAIRKALGGTSQDPGVGLKPAGMPGVKRGDDGQP